MTLKLFGSKGHKKHSPQDNHKKQNKVQSHGKHHHHHHRKHEEEDLAVSRKSFASEQRHVDSPRVAARKLLMSIMIECEQGADDDSFDKPSRDCEGLCQKARNVVAPERPDYNDNAGKARYSEDDMKPLLQQMGDSDDEEEEEEVPPPTTDVPPKETETTQQEQVERRISPSPRPITKRLSKTEQEREEEFKALVGKFKSLDDLTDDLPSSPAEKERQNIYDMEWFAKVEKEMKSPLERESGNVSTPTTHDESFNSHSEGLPEAPPLQDEDEDDNDDDSVVNKSNSPRSRELRRMKTSDSCLASSKNDPIYRQQTCDGEIVANYSDLFEAACQAQPVFEKIMKNAFHYASDASSDVMIARFAEIKDVDRAREKAEDKYANRNPGPALSWLYDIVRGSVLFTSPEAPMRCMEAFSQHPDVHVVNIQNKYANDGLERYKIFHLHLQIDTKLGFQHVCEMQIHHLDVDTLDLEQLDQDNLEDLLNTLNMKQLTRLSYLFSDQLCRYDWAEVVLNKLLKVQVGRLGHGHVKDAETYHRLGTILNEHLGRPEEAVAMFEKELEILKMHLGIHDMKVAETSAQIGDILHAQGETERALEHYGTAVEILELQKEHKEDFAWAKFTREDITYLMSAEEEIRESLEMYSKSLDKYKMTVEEGLSNLHRAFDEMQSQVEIENLDEVIKKNNESIDECQRALLEYNLDCHSLSEAAIAQGKVDEIFEVFAKSLIQSYQIRKLQQPGPLAIGSETKDEEVE